MSQQDEIEKKGDRIVVANVECNNAPKIPMKDTWKGLVEVKGDIVHFSDDEWESDSE